MEMSAIPLLLKDCRQDSFEGVQLMGVRSSPDFSLENLAAPGSPSPCSILDSIAHQ